MDINKALMKIFPGIFVRTTVIEISEKGYWELKEKMDVLARSGDRVQVTDADGNKIVFKIT